MSDEPHKNTLIAVVALAPCLILLASLSLMGCNDCGGLGERGSIPEAPFGAADDTVKFVVDDYISISYNYNCLNGKKVNIYYESGGVCVDWQVSEFTTECDTTAVMFELNRFRTELSKRIVLNQTIISSFMAGIPTSAPKRDLSQY